MPRFSISIEHGDDGPKDTPALPPNPITREVTRQRERDEPKPIDWESRQMYDPSDRKLGRDTTGPLINRGETIKQLGATMGRKVKLPIELKSSRQLRGKRNR